MTKILTELLFRRAACRKIRLIVRPPADVDIIERAHLEVVERLGKYEVHHRELHDVKNRFRRSDTQTLQRFDLTFHPIGTGIGMRLGSYDKPVEEAHHRGGGAALCAVERRVLRVGVGTRLHAGEADLQDIHPVRRGMIEVLADGCAPFLAHLGDRIAKPRRVLGVHVRRMAPEYRAHRALMTVPCGNRRKPVIL